MNEILCPNCGHHIATLAQVGDTNPGGWGTRLTNGRADHVGRFLSSLNRGAEATRVPTSQLYRDYTQWCDDNDIDPLGSPYLSHVLAETHGVGRTKSNGTRYYVLPGA
ncbi:primase-like DNA-binding domain-containing protein [Nocardia farcinica]|uniref:primase-like DNA-binding domain-containing protein n=1 Tax=Nocardia farcinica TaxID=37329 RepID=UPI0018942E59|nr:primase-like DNA-binding domain-containing protein [Nocardia farcinica]MBF6573765.1 hypothetical protein [Nocardia farcinica]